MKAAEIDLGNGKALRIRTENQGPENAIVKEVKLNGRTLEGPVVRHADLTKGGEMEFVFK